MTDRQRGFALLIVLWALALLALLTTGLVGTARTELQRAANERVAAELEAQADGLVYETIFRLMSDPNWVRIVDGRGHATDLAGAHGVVRVTSLAGKVNPNIVSEPMMAALLQGVGLPAKQAVAVAAAITDWRTPGQAGRPSGAKEAQYLAAGRPQGPPGEPFETVGELQQVLGMTPALASRLAPYLSIAYQGDPALSLADPLVAAAISASLGEETGTEASEDNAAYVEIDARAVRTDGRAFERRAVVWTGHGRQRGRYLVLGWDVPADTP